MRYFQIASVPARGKQEAELSPLRAEEIHSYEKRSLLLLSRLALRHVCQVPFLCPEEDPATCRQRGHPVQRLCCKQQRREPPPSPSPPGDTHRDEDAVEVPRFPILLAGPYDCCQLGHIVDPHDIDVVLTAEGLDEGEVDLQGDIPLVLLIGRQHAESHIVGIAARGEARLGSADRAAAPRQAQPGPRRPTYTFISLADS